MKDELIDVLDENGIKTGEVVTRKEIHKNGLWHRAIVVAIVNENNEILLQKRSSNKETNANMWDISVAGHISSGQDSLSAAAREINEEVAINLGYKVDIKEFRYMYSFKKEIKYSKNFIERQFYDFFILRKNDLKIENIKFQESEVQEIKFCSITELRELIDNNQVVERNAIYSELENYIFKII